MPKLPFRDRSEAGRLLGIELASPRLGPKTLGPKTLGPNLIVMALARGGVPVGAEVAAALSAPLDVMVVRKLGVPWQPELAMGAIARDTRVLDDSLIAALGISEREVEAVAARETEELARREAEYRHGRPEPALDGRTVVLVDDGLATGSSMIAAVRHARRARAKKLIVAVPVGSPEACERLRSEADQCICLAVQQPFHAVGEWYTDFRQVTDAEVHEILKRIHSGAETPRLPEHLSASNPG